MHIGILGSGAVARTLAAALTARGHGVTLGTRDPAATRARTDPDPFGGPTYAEWESGTHEVTLAPFADAAAAGEVLINATAGTASLDALASARADHVGPKLLLDVANPLDFSRGMPPTFTICNDDSLGERIQGAYPNLRVVKVLNTVNMQLMVAPETLAGGDHVLPLCGNDDPAKAEVRKHLREWFGWRDFLDLGDITAARGTEMFVAFWLRAAGALGTPVFNIKIQR